MVTRARSWRDPDSNRGHHDFSRVHRSLALRPKSLQESRFWAIDSAGLRSRDVRKLHPFVGGLGHETPLVAQRARFAYERGGDDSGVCRRCGAAGRGCSAVLMRNLKARPQVADLFGKKGRAWLAATEAGQAQG